MSSKFLAALSGNKSLAYLDSKKYSTSELMHSISFMFDYIMVFALCLVAGIAILPTHISIYSILDYTTAIRLCGTSHTEYKYKAFLNIISP